nr:unnamed protein product [Callosobruchus chinensis]
MIYYANTVCDDRKMCAIHVTRQLEYSWPKIRCEDITIFNQQRILALKRADLSVMLDAVTLML